MVQVNEKVNARIDESIGKMLERLKPSGWHDPLEFIIESTAFRGIMCKLIRDVDLQYHFYPKMMHWFRMFEECPFHSTRAAVMTGLPPKYWKMAVGVPYNTLEGRKSIIHEWFEREIRTTLGDNLYAVPTDMTAWTNQGLLLLPCGLTNGHGDHFDLWKPVMAEIMDMLSHKFPDIPWVLMGRQGKWYEEFVKGEVLLRQHPLNSRNVPWKGDGMFKKINEILLAQGKDDFIW